MLYCINFINRNKWLIAGLLILLIVLFPDASFAAPGKMTPQKMAGVFQTASSKLINLFVNSKRVLLVVGGFGLIAIAFQAIFGKVKWGWFASLAFGLAVVCAAGAIVKYAANDDDVAEDAHGNTFNDSYKSSGAPKVVDPSMATGSGSASNGSGSLSIE